jgi:hypothetical protein
MDEFKIDHHSGLALTFTRCSKCKSERLWRDINGTLRCWECVPPQTIARVILEEKRKAREREQLAVDDFIEEDEDIQEYNFKHFGQRIS